MEWLATLENSGLATWLRESNTIWAYPLVLTLHTVGLALLVGANWMLDLRVLGFMRQMAFADLKWTFRVMWIGFWVNAASGALLFAADATTKGSTRLFVGKLALVVLGVVVILLTKRALYPSGVATTVPGGTARALAIASIAIWVAAIAAGRFMAYIV
jgi:hypothetical protein